MERDLFGNPGNEYRAAPFWSWNDDLQGEELVRQIGEMSGQGLGGFFMHSRVGLVTPYMSHDYLARIRTCVEEAKRRGMGAWLYDEDKWPSGFAGGFVTAPDPAFRAKALVVRPAPIYYDVAESVATFVARVEDGRIVSAERLRQKPADPFASSPDKLYLHFYVWTAPLGNEWFNSFAYADLLNPEAVRAFIAANYEPYYREFGDEFGKTIPGIFTDEPCYLSVHATTPKPRVPWTTDLAAAFESARGYDLLAYLPALFYDVGDYEGVRYDFWRTVTDRFVDSFTRQVGEWCGEHGLALTGHVLLEDTLFAQTLTTGAAMPHYEYMQLPGIDHLNRNIANPLTVKQLDSAACQFGGRRTLSEMFGCSGQNMSFGDRKWIGDWHLLLGVNFVNPHLSLYSMRGARKRDFPPNLYFQQPYWPDDNLIQDYLGRLCYALTRGERQVDVLVVHPIASGWTLFRPEGCHQLRQLDADFAGLVDTLLGLHRDFHLGDDRILSGHGRVDGAKLRVGDMAYATVLIPAQPTLARSTFELLQRFVAAGGRVVAIEPAPTRLDGRPASELAAFLSRPGVVRVPFARADLDAALEDACPAAVRVAGEGAEAVWYHLRRDGDQTILFLANTDRERPREVVVTLPCAGALESWNPATGEVAPLSAAVADGRATVRLRFEAGGSHLIVGTLSRSASPAHRGVVALPSLPTSLPHGGREAQAATRPFPTGEGGHGGMETLLPDAWQVTRLAPNALTLDYCEYRLPVVPVGTAGTAIGLLPTDVDPATGWNREVPVWQADRAQRGDVFRNGAAANWFNVQPGIEQPFGLRFRFEVSPELATGAGRLALVVETPERFQLTLNGQTLPPPAADWWIDPCWRPIDVRPYVHSGENCLEIAGTFFHDTELESVYVVGDFAVESAVATDVAAGSSPKSIGSTSVEHPRFRLVSEETGARSGEGLERAGLPFYAGRLALRQTVRLDAVPTGRHWLDLGRVDAITATVRVNGRSAGTVAWAPWRAEVTGLLRAGENEIEVELATSLHNLLGPHHHRAGELRSVSPATFSDAAAWKDDYTLVPLGLAGVRLVGE